MDFSSHLFLLMVQTSSLILDLHWIIYYILFTALYLKGVGVYQLTGPAIC